MIEEPVTENMALLRTAEASLLVRSCQGSIAMTELREWSP